MSNLGLYQIMTTVAKKVGGPVNLALIIMGAGGGITLLGDFSIRAIIRKVREKKNSKQSDRLFVVSSSGADESGLTFSEGDSYRVMFADEEIVLVEKIGDNSNPYVVSPDFLRSVSDFI